LLPQASCLSVNKATPRGSLKIIDKIFSGYKAIFNLQAVLVLDY